MKTLRTTLLIILSFAGIFSLRAQTADEIINKHIAAIGGKDLLKSVKSLYTEGSMEVVGMGNEAPVTSYTVYGKAYKNVVNFNGQEIVQCSTEKGGWMINPMAGAATATPLPEDQANAGKLRFEHGGTSGPLIDYAAKGNKVELNGKDTAGGKTLYRLKVTTKDNISIEYYIDGATWYITKAVTKFTVQGQEIETTADLSDYKKLDNGVVLSYAQQLTFPQYTINLTLKKVEVNKAIDPAIFEMPK
jgi:outer membrane lipoprotein-sorting protein